MPQYQTYVSLDTLTIRSRKESRLVAGHGTNDSHRSTTSHARCLFRTRKSYTRNTFQPHSVAHRGSSSGRIPSYGPGSCWRLLRRGPSCPLATTGSNEPVQGKSREPKNSTNITNIRTRRYVQKIKAAPLSCITRALHVLPNVPVI